MQRLVLVLAAAVAAAGGPAGRGTDPAPVSSWLDVYGERHQTGIMFTFQDSASRLGGWNDYMRSACLNGFWVFFENDRFNYQSGRAMWSYGFNYCFTFLMDFDKKVSSVRRVGDYHDAAAASITLYDGTFYSGEERFIDTTTHNVTKPYGYQSVIVSGPDAWTIFSGDTYTGHSVCLYAEGQSAVSPSGQKIQYGLFPSTEYLGAVGNNISSVRKGCYSGQRVRAEPLDPANHLSHFVEEEKQKSEVGNAG